MRPGHLIRCLLRFTNDLVDTLNEAIPNGDVQYWSWENRTEETALPHTNLLGLADFSFDDASKIWISRFSLVYSSYRDANLLNESFVLDVLYDSIKRLDKIPLRDNNDGSIVSEAIITACSVLPSDTSLLRNYRPFALEIQSTGPVGAGD